MLQTRTDIYACFILFHQLNFNVNFRIEKMQKHFEYTDSKNQPEIFHSFTFHDMGVFTM